VPEKERFLRTTRDLGAIAITLARHDLPWLLVTYPQREFRWQRKAAELLASRLHVPLVHTADDLARALSDHPDAKLICTWPIPDDETCLMVNAMGPHPTRLLYGYITQSIADAVLVASQRVPASSRLPGR
jgi:hypothetical protein